jgi:hypothetical protein
MMPVLGRRDTGRAMPAGVSTDGTGSHRIVIEAGPFTDADGFAWEAAAPNESKAR